MRDQAENLRMKLGGKESGRARTLAVVSGKGGVGKSNISSNLALVLAEWGKKVLVVDLDIGMGNIGILLGGSVNKTMGDFIFNKEELARIVQKGPGGVSFIAGGNGFHEAAELDEYTANRLLSGLKKLQRAYDFIIFDMAAGASGWMLHLSLAADEAIVVTTPEAAAIMDAYSMMKLIHRTSPDTKLSLVCNRSDDVKQGLQTYERLKKATEVFLKKELSFLGILPEDKHMRKSALSNLPIYIRYPKAPVSVNLKKIAQRLVVGGLDGGIPNEKETFISRLRNLFDRS